MIRIVVVVGILLVGVLIGLIAFPRLRRLPIRSWKPGAAMLSLAFFVAATAAATLKIWPLALLLFLVGSVVSMGVRRTRARPHQPAGEAPPPRRRGGMSVEEARNILGVGPEATSDEVQAAYLRLIRRAHPDQGGTSGLASQLNTARDTLLGKK
jgi:hypothetical protein